MDLGLIVTEAILGLSRLLVHPTAPGWTALVLVATLCFLVMSFAVSVWLQLRSLKRFNSAARAVSQSGRFPSDTSALDSFVEKKAADTHGKRVSATWIAHRQTMLTHEGEDAAVLLATVRPSTFWNSEDLGMDQGMWKIVPGTFVSVGLFLTFLGLVAALTQTETLLGSAGDAQEGLRQLLKTASAKFIMSLTGLACSIVFGLVLRIGTRVVDQRISQICSLLEKRVPLVSLAAITHEQLVLSYDTHNTAVQAVERLSLDVQCAFEKLPAAMVEAQRQSQATQFSDLGHTITDALSPVLEELRNQGSKEGDSLSKQLGQQLVAEVSGSLQQAGSGLAEATDRMSDLLEQIRVQSAQRSDDINGVAGRMSSFAHDLHQASAATAVKMEETLSTGIQQLLTAMNNSLDRISQNTSVGARELSAAATELGIAAGQLKREFAQISAEFGKIIEGDLKRLSSEATFAMDDTIVRIEQQFAELLGQTAKTSRSMNDTLNDGILERFEAISGNLDALNRQLVVSTREFVNLNDNLRAGAKDFCDATYVFQQASRPVLEASERQERILLKLHEAVGNLQVSSATGAKIAEKGLMAVSNAAEAVGTVTEDFARQAKRLDQMDATLGRAFEAYATNIESGLDMLKTYVADISSEIAPAIERMHEVVVHAEQFVSTSKHARMTQ